MPPEPTKAKLKRKLGRREVEEYKFDGGHAREIEQKRNSGQISCAECRRLKIKCDKQIPCQSCQRRGCTALCPNGSLSTGQGTRFVLAATEHLHHQIAKMSQRIRELEDALGDLQAQHSTEPHPLLREDLLGVNRKEEDSKEEAPQDESGVAGHPPELLEAFGTLSITDHGISRFFGPTGGSECLLMASRSGPPSSSQSQSDNVTQQDGPGSSPPDSARDPGPSQLPQDLRWFSQAFPFTPMGPTGSVRELIEAYLPNWERASYLSQIYIDQAGWLFHCVNKDQIDDELLPLYYSNAPLKATEEKNVHELALLFLIFAVGALVDVVQETSNAEAEHYHQIARAAICLQPVLEKPSLVTIQALHMLSMYNAMSGNELSGKETSMETTWSLIVLAAHLAQTIGLHRDSARWALPDKIVQRRRVLFWDLFVADAWESLNTGRPPCFSLAFIDCRYPGPENVSDQMDVETEIPFESWNYRFATECVAEVAARTLTAEIPTYATIMELDRKVREFPVSEEAENVATSLISPIPTNPLQGLSLPDSMGRFVMANAREVILLYIHRCFFAQAIIENPVNPLKSQYSSSFLATYRASSIILRTIGAHYSNYPQLCARFWSVWTFAFSAAIVFGTIVTRGPRSPLASNAMKELDEACVLFSKAACYSRRAAKALPILKKLSEKAHNALATAQNDRSSSSSSSPSQLGQQWSFKEGADVDELAIFAGRTRFVSTRRLVAESKQTQTQTPALPEGGRSSGPESASSSYGASLPGPTAPPLPPSPPTYGAEDTISSIERWADTTDREQMQLSYSVRHAPAAHPPHPRPSAAEYVNVGLEPEPQPQQVMPEWRPPRRSHYTYTPQHQHQHNAGPSLSSGSLPQPQLQPPLVAPAPAPAPTSHHQPQHTRTHSGHEHAVSMTTPSYHWAPSSSEMSSHFEDAGGYGTSAGTSYLGHHNVHAHAHGHAYESLHTSTYQPPPHPLSSSLQAPVTSIQASTLAPAPPPLLPPLQSLPAPSSAPALPPQHYAPSELTDLGLVAEVSRLDERWTSFMRDSGYFEGFGYRGR